MTFPKYTKQHRHCGPENVEGTDKDLKETLERCYIVEAHSSRAGSLKVGNDGKKLIIKFHSLSAKLLVLS
jgi:hypothetical protein